MNTNDKRRRRFSEAFRREQVELIESGERTIAEVSRLYDVSYTAVNNWVKKYSKKGYPDTRYVTSEADVHRLKDLEKEVKQLKEIIGEQQVQILYQEKLIKLAEERLGKDFKKK